MKKTKYKDGGFLTKKSLNKIKQEVNKRKLIIYTIVVLAKLHSAIQMKKKYLQLIKIIK